MKYRISVLALSLLCVLLIAVTPVLAQDAPADTAAPPGITFSDDTLAALFAAVLGIFGTFAALVLQQRGHDSRYLADSIPLPFAQLGFTLLSRQAAATADPLDDQKLLETARKLGWDVYLDQFGKYHLTYAPPGSVTLPSEPRASPASSDSPTGM